MYVIAKLNNKRHCTPKCLLVSSWRGFGVLSVLAVVVVVGGGKVSGAYSFS